MCGSMAVRVYVILLFASCELCTAAPSEPAGGYESAITSATVIAYGAGTDTYGAWRKQIIEYYGETPLEKDRVRILCQLPGAEYLDNPTSTVVALIAPKTGNGDFLELMKPFELNWFSYSYHATDRPDIGFMYWRGNSIVVILFNGINVVLDNPALRKTPKSLDLLYNLKRFVDNAHMGTAPGVRLKRLR